MPEDNIIMHEEPQPDVEHIPAGDGRSSVPDQTWLDLDKALAEGMEVRPEPTDEPIDSSPASRSQAEDQTEGEDAGEDSPESTSEINYELEIPMQGSEPWTIGKLKDFAANHARDEMALRESQSNVLHERRVVNNMLTML